MSMLRRTWLANNAKNYNSDAASFPRWSVMSHFAAWANSHTKGTKRVKLSGALLLVCFWPQDC